MSKGWSQPKPLDDLAVAFPASVRDLLPAYDEVPEEFKDWSRRGLHWNYVVSRWFFRGLKGRFIPKPGVDHKTAMRHLKAVLGSFEPKHEHKEAGAAYLCSLWFERYEPAPEEAKEFAQ